jgi:RNA polymerase sigma-70 factor (ECF subfamily)
MVRGNRSLWRPKMTATGSRPAAGPDRDLPDVAFDHFYRHEYRSVYALCLALAGAASADDLAQDAFIRAHRQWEQIVAYDVPAAWVRRVAINLATSLARRSAAEGRAVRRFAGRRESSGPHRDPELLDPDDRLWTEVRRLPPRQASILVLHYVEDLSVDQIAALLGLSANTVKVHLHRGRAALARRLPMAAEGGAADA